MANEPEKGTKYDHGKLQWWLLPWLAVSAVVRVLMFGAKKYSPDNWKVVPNPGERYWNAALRHMIAWREGETHDPESKEHHLAHAVCCLLFLLWFESTPKK